MNHHAAVLIDVAGTELAAADRRRLQHSLVGGVTLFARNFGDRRQLTELCAAIKSLREDLLICVDHEGGRVQRFRSDGFTTLPAMRTLGALWMQDPLTATDAASALGYVLAAELRACGVDLSFAPVLDLDHGGSTVIGERAFHRDARVTTLLAKSVAHGMLRAGMAHCGKHFPGHGFVKADSHVAVPVDRRSLKAVLADDARPYEWLSTTLTAVMAAHVVYPKVDHRPAGFSERWIKDVLRQQLGFTGAVFTDDLAMEGARHLGAPRAGLARPAPRGGSSKVAKPHLLEAARNAAPLGFAEAAAEALNAGCDLALLCNQSVVDGGAPLDQLLNELPRLAQQGRWQPDPDSEARRLGLLPHVPPLAWDELMHDPAYQHALERLP